MIIFAGTLDGDFDDVRNLIEAAKKGIKRARQAGSISPLVILPSVARFPLAARASLLGLLHGLYTPIEVRETKPSPTEFRKMERIGVYSTNSSISDPELSIVGALEEGRIVARDIGGSDPERMAAPRVADYISQLFQGSCVKVDIISDRAVFEKSYPLLAAVDRCSADVKRHAGRLINLEYTGEGPITKTLLLVGKGITYDTGGADIKAGGVMAGMHRDKCGAAAVAGFFQFLAVHKPKHLRVLGGLAMVRNSVGAECYVSDEIITSRAGVRVRVGNTDAEGRMVMADVLCAMKEKALNEVNPQIFTIATLTGHVIRCYGENYTSVIDNGPAWQANVSKQISEAADLCGEPAEVRYAHDRGLYPNVIHVPIYESSKISKIFIATLNLSASTLYLVTTLLYPARSRVCAKKTLSL